MSHLAMELFKTMSGVNVVHVPYRGSAPAAVDLIAGQVQLAMNNIVPTLPHVKSGRLRALGVSGPLRSPVLPEVPTVAEAGLPGFESLSWYGLWAPAGTSPELVGRLQAEVARAFASPDLKDNWSAQGAEPGGETSDQFARLVSAEIGKWGKVVRDNRIALD